MLYGGDFVSGHVQGLTMPIDKIAKGLGEIKSKYGFYTSLGNHDKYLGTEKIKYENPDEYASRSMKLMKFDVDTKGYKMELRRNIDDIHIDVVLSDEKDDSVVSEIKMVSYPDKESKKDAEKYYTDPKECKKTQTKIGGVEITKYSHLERSYGYDKSECILWL